MKTICRHTTLVFLSVISLTVISGLTSCNKANQDDELAFENADGVNGGKMYDKAWANETDFVSPSDANVNMEDISGYSDFYRCKACHGWDQLGDKASYIDRGPKTSRPSVASGNLHAFITSSTIREIYDAIEGSSGREVDASRTSDGTNGNGDAHPNYGSILSEDQIWDIVKFLKDRAFDVTKLYDIQTEGVYPTGSRTFVNVGKDGDATAGTTFYADNCAMCHGANGRDNNGVIVSINEDIGKSMGEFARAKPYELQHKAVYGNLGSSMGSTAATEAATMTDIKNMLKALSDSDAFPDL